MSYGAFRNRFKQVAVNAGATETTLTIAGLLEKVSRGSLIEYRHLIHGGKGTAAIHTRRSGGTPATDTVYVHTDHLGSPELLTSAAGGELLRLSFGAYGERRDGSDWDGPVSSADLTKIGNTGRHGFTEHEHLDAVGLIHMNGRVYEPVAGRFLGADPILSLGNSQDVNSYSYAWNNPLNVTDPTGFDDQDMTHIFPIDPIGVYGQREDPWANELTLEQVMFQARDTAERMLAGILERMDTVDDLDDNPKQDPRCSTPLPDGSTVNDNVRNLQARAMEAATSPHASDAALFGVYGYFVGMVQGGGRWDYKRQPGGSDEMGNFNYGATGSVLFGTELLQRAAGGFQLMSDPSRSDGGTPLTGFPFGDQFLDQQAIIDGANAGCG